MSPSNMKETERSSTSRSTFGRTLKLTGPTSQRSRPFPPFQSPFTLPNPSPPRVSPPPSNKTFE